MSLPRIAAIVGHADETELLERCIAHHARLGVAAFFVSADADSLRSPHELDRLGAREDVRLAYRRRGPAGYDVFGSALQATVDWARPDWVVLLDSDELCMAAHGDLRTIAALASADIVQLPRYNVPPIRSGDGTLGNADLTHAAEARFVRKAHRRVPEDFAERMSPPWIMSQVAPRVIFRPHSAGRVRVGGHDVGEPGRDAVRAVAADACVLHFPFTTFDRFCRKMEHVARAVDEVGALFQPHEGLHWRRWAALARRGELRAEFEDQVLDEERAAALVREGALATAAELFGTVQPGL